MIVTVEKAKEYLRVDSNLEDALIENLILSAEKFCADVARMEVIEFEEIGELSKVSTLYKLPLILRALLLSVREFKIQEVQRLQFQTALNLQTVLFCSRAKRLCLPNSCIFAHEIQACLLFKQT